MYTPLHYFIKIKIFLNINETCEFWNVKPSKSTMLTSDI